MIDLRDEFQPVGQLSQAAAESAANNAPSARRRQRKTRNSPQKANADKATSDNVPPSARSIGAISVPKRSACSGSATSR
jgi:sRNA-binding protein